MDEILDIFDENMNLIGQKERAAVHRDGDWHQTFHCWIILEDSLSKYILYQIRSDNKDTFPNFFDVSSAGHLLAEESPEDGVRELKEELGLDVRIEDLTYLGIVRGENEGEDFIDREFSHVYVYKMKDRMDELNFQLDEIKGLSKIPLEAAKKLLGGESESVSVDTVEVALNGEILNRKRQVSLKNFVPISREYYNLLLKNVFSC